MNAQDKGKDPLPYEKIPEYPETYTPGTVVSRLIDGLGFRYYWATEGLREQDLAFAPVSEARTIDQTLDHILGLSRGILKSAKQEINDRTRPVPGTFSFEEKRRFTLNNLREASAIFKEVRDLQDYPVIFKNPEGETRFPFWNLINGQMADALWHTGQVVSLRRQSGNPIPGGVSVFLGVRRNP